jgi:hypothetical protein
MTDEQIQAALDSAAGGLSPFFHSTAEELEKLLAVLITLDMLGNTFSDLMAALCAAEGGGEIMLCHEFAPALFTTSPESEPQPTTPA